VIERLCRRDAGYRFLVGDDVPDHTVIARFRQRHAGRMKSLFLQVLELCREAGLIRLGLVALDGTKVKANAALDANRTAGTIEEQIARMLVEAEATDAREDRQFGPEASGPAMPRDLKRRGDRLARLKACQETLESRAAATAARQQEKIAAREAEEQATGKRKRGRKPKDPDPRVDPDTVANPTDPDSGIMKTRRGWVQGYNAQAVVTPDQIILAADVTTEANDVHQLTGMLDQAQANVEAVMGEDAVLGAAVADAGYWSEANAASQTEECELFIATQKDRKQRAAVRDAPAPRGRMPKSMTARGAHGPQAAHQARPCSLPPARGRGRTGVRADEGPAGRWPLQHARSGTLPRRVAARRRRPQPPQTAPGLCPARGKRGKRQGERPEDGLRRGPLRASGHPRLRSRPRGDRHRKFSNGLCNAARRASCTRGPRRSAPSRPGPPARR
jgi:transposase-like protein DUF772